MAQAWLTGESRAPKGTDMRFQAFLVVIAGGTATLTGSVLADKSLTLGAGATVCAEFVRTAGPDGLSDGPSLQWVLGYFAGNAAASPKSRRPLPAVEDIAREVLVYCQAHPHGRLVDAATSLFVRKRYCGAAHGCA